MTAAPLPERPCSGTVLHIDGKPVHVCRCCPELWFTPAPVAPARQLRVAR